MIENLQSRQWKNWSYEHTSQIITKRFPNSIVWLVHPSRMHDGMFSCYYNFINCDLLGSPENFEYHDAIVHLEMLIRQGTQRYITKQTSQENKAESCRQESPSSGNLESLFRDLPVTLVGFSKGCMVLNQIITEIGKCPVEISREHYDHFCQRLKSIIWLDGGHSNPDINVWITERKTLSKLASRGYELQVHVTPWQVQDMVRPHIGEQQRLFVDSLRSCGGKVTEKVHFPGERIFENHFNILKEF